jgi:hypothetical protein
VLLEVARYSHVTIKMPLQTTHGNPRNSLTSCVAVSHGSTQ